MMKHVISGVIGRKMYSDNTLLKMKKTELIELLHIAEHNYNALNGFYERALDNSKCRTCPLGSTREEKGNY